MYRTSFGRELSYGRKSNRTVKYALAALALVLVFAVGLVGCQSYYAKSPVTVTVEDKESINTKEGHEYRVYTDSATYVVEDSLINTQFNTADVYRKLRVGHTYDCQAYGWRVPFLSMFKALQDCEEARAD